MTLKEKPVEEVIINSKNTKHRKEDYRTIFKNCFVITPIGNENDPIRRHINGIYDIAIAPVLKEFEYTPEIPHRISLPGSINKQIIKKIYDSDLVLANLTNINPNVMYELALRHCFNKPSIIIAEDGTDLPFDINKERTIFYINDAQGILDLKNKLRKAIRELIAEKSYTSPIISVLGEIKFEEEILKKNDQSKDNSFVDALQVILKRLDRIEYETINNNERNLNNTIEKIGYIISASSDYDRDFEMIISQFIESCKAKNFNVRGCYISEKTYQVFFVSTNPVMSSSIASHLIEFCNTYKLKYECTL